MKSRFKPFFASSYMSLEQCILKQEFQTFFYKFIIYFLFNPEVIPNYIWNYYSRQSEFTLPSNSQFIHNTLIMIPDLHKTQTGFFYRLTKIMELIILVLFEFMTEVKVTSKWEFNGEEIKKQDRNSEIFGGKTKKPKRYTPLALRKAIERENIQRVSKILGQNPQLLSTSPQNPFIFACLSQKKSIIRAVMAMPEISAAYPSVFNLALIQCIRHMKISSVRILVECGCDPNIIIPQRLFKLTTLDYAILGGHYEIALFLLPKMNFTNRKLRTVQEYFILSKKLKYRYVNFQEFLKGIKHRISPKQMGGFLKKDTSSQKQINNSMATKFQSEVDRNCWDRFLSLFIMKNEEQKPFEADTSKKTTSTEEQEAPKDQMPITQRNLV